VAESKSQSSRKGDPCQIAKLWKPNSTPQADFNMGGAPRPLFLICGAGSKKDINGEASNASLDSFEGLFDFLIDLTILLNDVLKSFLVTFNTLD
jgi:hypothetical protein